MSGTDGAIAGVLTVLALAALFLAMLYGVIQVSKVWKR
jgi:hypothetical protein